ncbi:MAG: hypothetical protein SPJ59_04660 [Peptoniphilaceae bacterium]|nr:hypothetical protein [Peptoniphilaceae bacterium]
MDRLKELKEAKQASETVLEQLGLAMDSLKKAKTSGILDIFAGRFWISLIKRNQIQHANANIAELKMSLYDLSKELSDIAMELPSEIGDQLTDRMLDMVFDNIFTDLRVQGEIQDKLNELASLRQDVLKIDRKLAEEMEKLQQSI